MPLLKRISDSLFGQSAKTTLPAYVQLAIKQQQDASEKLISWTLLFIVTVFSALYIVSPKTFSAMAQFAPVPWALSAYFIFSLLRLGLSYRRYLPTWLLILSIIIDISLLMILIWSFHLQYQQPASFYLKAPT